MKELLKQYATYNVWATQRLLDAILALPEEQQMEEVPSSFNSLYKTILHMLDAESIWWQRMKMQERITRPSQDFNGTTQEAAAKLLQQSKQWEEWIGNATDLLLDHVFQYQNIKGEQLKMPIYQMLLHVNNHATFHRGQLINMLRQLKAEKIPNSDFSSWVFSKK